MEYASADAYVVMPPCASDMLSLTLRESYRAPTAETNPFGDLLDQLDLIETASQ